MDNEGAGAVARQDVVDQTFEQDPVETPEQRQERTFQEIEEILQDLEQLGPQLAPLTEPVSDDAREIQRTMRVMMTRFLSLTRATMHVETPDEMLFGRTPEVLNRRIDCYQRFISVVDLYGDQVHRSDV